MTPDPARRRSLLTAALGFALLDTRGKPAPPEVHAARRWLDIASRPSARGSGGRSRRDRGFDR